MWNIETNVNNEALIRNNGSLVAVVLQDQTLRRYSSVRIPITILRCAGANQSIIDEVRAQDARHNANRTHRTILTEGFDNNRTFGIELECYHPSDSDIKQKIVDALARKEIACTIVGYTHQVMDSWKITTDASLDGYETMEIVSPILKGENGLEQIRKVTSTLISLGVKVNKSCGTHVHHQAKDLNRNQLKNCFDTYKINESIIDSIMAPSRRANNCRWAAPLTNLDYSTFRRNYGERGRNYHRYHKLNAQCFSIYGTIEFRQHQGTLNAEKIINWIKFSQAILIRGKGIRYNNLNDMISQLKVDDNGFFANRQIVLSA